MANIAGQGAAVCGGVAGELCPFVAARDGWAETRGIGEEGSVWSEWGLAEVDLLPG